MRSRGTGLTLDKGQCRKLAAVFRAPARPYRGVPACNESAPSAEPQNLGPYNQFRDHVYAAEDEDFGEQNTSFGRQLPLQHAPAEVAHWQLDEADRSFAARHHLQTTTDRRGTLWLPRKGHEPGGHRQIPQKA